MNDDRAKFVGDWKITNAYAMFEPLPYSVTTFPAANWLENTRTVLYSDPIKLQ